ncbi:50S ribosomal protein L25/general stress protein Ctc [soil metagenome]
MEQKLKADRREDSGKGAARKARAAGRVPGVVYGHGADPLHISVDARDLFHTLHTEAGVNVLVDLRVDGDHFLAMPREVQRDHLRGRLLHVDFLRIARDEKITVEVPIQLVGESHGVKEGGVIEHHLWTLQVECFPQDVPTSIDADVSALGLNESLKVEDLQLPDKLELQTPLEEVVVSVVPPQVLKLEEEEEALEEAAEGEGEPTQDLASGESAAEGEG